MIIHLDELSESIHADCLARKPPLTWELLEDNLRSALCRARRETFTFQVAGSERRVFVSILIDLQCSVAVVGNDHLPAPERLGDAALERLRQLGFAPPGEPGPAGSAGGTAPPAWHRLARPSSDDPAWVVATLLAVFREVFGLEQPTALTYNGVDADGVVTYWPILGIPWCNEFR